MQTSVRLFLAGVCLALTTSLAQAQIRVAVEDGSANGTGAAVVAQLNDDTYFDFDATLVVAADIDTAGELAAYDVVVLGGSGFTNADWTAPMAAALRAWVEAGGGAVFTGWGNLELPTAPGAADLEAIMPTQNIPSTNEFGYSPNTIDILAAHPVVDGIPDFSIGDFADDCCIEGNAFPAEAGDTVLATMTLENPAGPGIVVAVKQPGAGCTAYLGPIYFGSATQYPDVTPALRSGYPDQLLEQAADWAATCFEAPVAQAIPTLSEAGAAALVVALVLAGVVLLLRRSRLDRA